MLSAGRTPQVPLLPALEGIYALKELHWSTAPLPSSTLTMSSAEVTLHHFPCSKYLLRCLYLALPVCETSPQPGPCEELCCKASVELQTGEMSGETGGTTSTGGKS